MNGESNGGRWVNNVKYLQSGGPKTVMVGHFLREEKDRVLPANLSWRANAVVELVLFFV
jgi:hypothetical protein